MSGRRWHHWRPKHLRRQNRDGHSTPDDIRALDGKIDALKRELEHADETEKPIILGRLLVLQAPRAARAQAQMDAHRGGYHNREKRLYELIDFNDTFVSLVLALPHRTLPGFAERVHESLNTFCRQHNTVSFSDEQFDAIVRGLSREIAVFRGAKAEGFRAEMTSRTEDAFGIDMVIRDRAGRSANIDCKTPSAFRYRLNDLEKEKRITTNQVLAADAKDYITIVNKHNGDNIAVTIMCIRPERLGDIVDFSFTNTKPLTTLLHTILAESSRHQR